MCQSQSVATDGDNSLEVQVLSEVPEGTVLGCLVFLLCIKYLENIVPQRCAAC